MSGEILRAPAGAPLRRLAHGLEVLWRFSRPHTIIGTALSVVGLYLLTTAALPGVAPTDGVGDLAWTLVAALCVNVFIVGINELEDVEIDRVNKPYLPLASGELSRGRARAIVAVCAAVPLALALTQGAVELVGVVAGLVVGTAYSCPPLRLKRFPTLASLSITGVRAVVVNLGVALHFTASLAGTASLGAIPGPVWALTLFVLPFSFAIAILKDLPDAEGDRRYAIATFTVRAGPRRVLHAGLAALTFAYLGMAIAGPLLLADVQPILLAATHLAALTLLWRWALRLDLREREAVIAFYMRVWKLFFAEYLLVVAAVLAG